MCEYDYNICETKHCNVCSDKGRLRHHCKPFKKEGKCGPRDRNNTYNYGINGFMCRKCLEVQENLMINLKVQQIKKELKQEKKDKKMLASLQQDPAMLHRLVSLSQPVQNVTQPDQSPGILHEPPIPQSQQGQQPSQYMQDLNAKPEKKDIDYKAQYELTMKTNAELKARLEKIELSKQADAA
jgi:hypothetical protein